LSSCRRLVACQLNGMETAMTKRPLAGGRIQSGNRHV
jgi:hypothetical protein